MIKSMTGYGHNSLNINQRDITVELKSVNHRFFDFNPRIPRVYGFLEDKAKNYLQNYISRGKIDFSVIIDSSNSEDTVVKVNHTVIKSYIEAFKEIAQTYNIENDVKVSDFLKVQDSFSVKKVEADQEVLWKDVKEVIDLALNDFLKMRETEGNKLSNDLLKKLDELSSIVLKIEPLEQESIDEYRKKQFDNMSEFLKDSTIDENRILAEVAIFADKVAVDEEIVRLKSHIAQFKTIINEDVPVGRRLDFLLQEMNREINTIGSKASNIEISNYVVNFKALLEKVREQIQNVE